MRRTWQFVARQSECIPNDLLVYLALDFEYDLADGHSACPVIERSLALAHTCLVTTLADANVGRDAGI